MPRRCRLAFRAGIRHAVRNAPHRLRDLLQRQVAEERQGHGVDDDPFQAPERCGSRRSGLPAPVRSAGRTAATCRPGYSSPPSRCCRCRGCGRRPAPLLVKRGAALLYQVTVDNQLSHTVNVKHPVRGNSAFQTDLCVFEQKSEDVSIHRVVMEFKTRISTHDVLTYSAKATKHTQVYPYISATVS